MTSLAFVRRVIALSSQPRSDEVEVEDLGTTTRKSTEGQPGRWRASRETQIAAAIPFVVTAVLYAVPGYYGRLFVSPPDIIGVPFGFVLQLITLAWAALGVAVVAQTRFRFMAALALTVCTIPAAIGVVVVARLIEIMQNLG
jgi:hypothetical protein